MKKSQISLFVIIGLVVLIVAVFLIIKINQDRLNQIKLQGETENPKLQPVVRFVNDCLELKTKEALIKLGEQGLIYPDAYLASKNTKIAYFYFKGRNYFPKKEAIEKEVSDYVIENMKSCTGDFSKIGFTVDDSYEKMKAEIVFDEKRLNISTSYPMKILLGEEEAYLEKFSIEVKINLNGIYNAAEKIYKETEQNSETINLDFLKDLPFEIRLIKIDKNTLVYEILDSKYGLENKPYKYRFAVKYE
jgi:hypothetical protein